MVTWRRAMYKDIPLGEKHPLMKQNEKDLLKKKRISVDSLDELNALVIDGCLQAYVVEKNGIYIWDRGKWLPHGPVDNSLKEYTYPEWATNPTECHSSEEEIRSFEALTQDELDYYTDRVLSGEDLQDIEEELDARCGILQIDEEHLSNVEEKRRLNFEEYVNKKYKAKIEKEK